MPAHLVLDLSAGLPVAYALQFATSISSCRLLSQSIDQPAPFFLSYRSGAVRTNRWLVAVNQPLKPDLAGVDGPEAFLETADDNDTEVPVYLRAQERDYSAGGILA